MVTVAPDTGIHSLEQVSRPCPLLGSDGMGERLNDASSPRIPLTGAGMQTRYECRLRFLQAVTQGFGKEGVIAIPAALRIPCY